MRRKIEIWIANTALIGTPLFVIGMGISGELSVLGTIVGLIMFFGTFAVFWWLTRDI